MTGKLARENIGQRVKSTMFFKANASEVQAKFALAYGDDTHAASTVDE
jgi:hypothetical protein